MIGVLPKTIRKWRGELFSDIAGDVATATPAEVWVSYKIRQEGVISDLDRIIKASRGTKSGGVLNAAVGAAKAKAQLIDGIIEKGQELGIIHKEPEKAVTINGVEIHSAEMVELEGMLEEKRRVLNELVSKHGVSNYSEEDDGDLYADDPLAPTRTKH